MRINVYSQELTSEIKLIEKLSDTGLTYSAVQLMLHSPRNCTITKTMTIAAP